MDRVFLTTITFLLFCFFVISSSRASSDKKEDETCSSNMTADKIEEKLTQLKE